MFSHSFFRTTSRACLIMSAIILTVHPVPPVLATQKVDINAGYKSYLNFFNGGQFDAAEVEIRRLMLAVKAQFGEKHANYAMILNGLGNVYLAKDRYPEAEITFRQSLSIREKALGVGHQLVAHSLTGLAGAFKGQGKYREAIISYTRALAILEKASGADHVDVATVLNNLAGLSLKLAKYTDAETQYQRALAIREKASGPNHLSLAGTLTNLATTYRYLGRQAESLPLLRRSLAIQETALGRDHPDLATSLSILGDAYRVQGNFADAESFQTRAVRIREKVFGPENLSTAIAYNNLALIYRDTARFREAEALHLRVVAIFEKINGPDNPETLMAHAALGEIYQRQRDYAKAAIEFERSSLGLEKALGPAHADVARSFFNLGSAYALVYDYGKALTYFRKATSAVLAADSEAVQGPSLAQQRRNYFHVHAIALWEAKQQGKELEGALNQEAFRIAQWASSSTSATAIQQTALRVAAGQGKLFDLVRENQDLMSARQNGDQSLVAALSKASSTAGEIRDLRREISQIDSRRKEISRELNQNFPEYVSLTKPSPVEIETVQKLLRSDEALVFFHSISDKSYVYALTSNRFDWKQVPFGTNDLSKFVADFRRGLEVEAVDAKGANAEKQFNLSFASNLYSNLLGPVDSVIGDKKSLIIVPSGPLTALPFHLLVTDKSSPTGSHSFDSYRNAAWLIKRQAITILPAVGTLQALRATGGNRNPGSKAMIGFGDPAFNPAQPKAKGLPAGRTAARNLTTRSYSEFWRGAGIDRARLVQALPDLPDTAVELNAVAKSVGAPASDIHLGADASETVVKRAALFDYRVLYFATHALVAGDVVGLAEPSLVLSIPFKLRVSGDREHGFHRIVSNDFRGS